MKKAQGLSMNVIIIAALALIVLVILAVIFMNRMGQVVTEADSCTNNGGRCVADKEDCDGPYENAKPLDTRGYICPGRDINNPSDNEYCCVGIEVAAVK